MAVLSIVLVLCFSVTLSIVEMPKMLRKKEYKEFAVFTGLLSFGTVIAVLKCLDFAVPNPADFVAAIYAPVVDLLKGILE